MIREKRMKIFSRVVRFLVWDEGLHFDMGARGIPLRRHRSGFEKLGKDLNPRASLERFENGYVPTLPIQLG